MNSLNHKLTDYDIDDTPIGTGYRYVSILATSRYLPFHLRCFSGIVLFYIMCLQLQINKKKKQL